MRPEVGISQIEIAIPEYFISTKKIAERRGESVGFATKGLGTFKARIPYNTSREELIKRALQPIDTDDIERFYIATESDYDLSKPTLGLEVINKVLKRTVVPFQLKFACLSGVQALLSACEYSVAHDGKPAGVIAFDNSIYDQAKTELTVGCATVAMRVEVNPELLSLDYRNYGQYSQDIDDFKVPAKTAPFPVCQGQLTKPAYLKCQIKALEDWMKKNSKLGSIIDNMEYFVFHTPFSKIVEWISAVFLQHEKCGSKKALALLEKSIENPDEFCDYKEHIDKIRKTSEFQKFFQDKVKPGLQYNPSIGNCFTVSIFISLISVLEQIKRGQQVSIAGYGSGAGSFFLTTQARNSGFKSNLKEQIQQGRELTFEEYESWKEEFVRKVRGDQAT